MPSKTFLARNLILATGVKDNLPELEGLADLWGFILFHRYQMKRTLRDGKTFRVKGKILVRSPAVRSIAVLLRNRHQSFLASVVSRLALAWPAKCLVLPGRLQAIVLPK